MLFGGIDLWDAKEQFYKLVFPKLEPILDTLELSNLPPETHAQIIDLMVSGLIGALYEVCERRLNWKGTLSQFSKLYHERNLAKVSSGLEKIERNVNL